MSTHRGRRKLLATAAVLVVFAAAGCTPDADLGRTLNDAASEALSSAEALTESLGSEDAPASSEGAGTALSANADPAEALALLEELPVKGRAPKTGYDRDAFEHWSDLDGDQCDARNEILARDLVDVELDADGCTVLSGTLHDPYTGQTIDFQRGAGSSDAVHIDHLVSLSDAHQKGAQGWDAQKREAFANDPDNLLAVDGPANSAKSDADAATWLPPAKSYRCEMVAAQVHVKHEYGLWVTDAEHQAMSEVLGRC